MAIVIEEEKSRFNWFFIAVVAAIVGIVAVAAYYLFFAPVPFIEKVVPSGSLRAISNIDLDPAKIENNETFKILRAYDNNAPVLAPGRRVNPFVPVQ